MEEVVPLIATGSFMLGDQVPSDATALPPSVMPLVALTEGALSRIAVASVLPETKESVGRLTLWSHTREAADERDRAHARRSQRREVPRCRFGTSGRTGPPVPPRVP